MISHKKPKVIALPIDTILNLFHSFPNSIVPFQADVT